MRSRLLILAILLLSIAVVGQAFGATITASPNKVPKGAYVNGPGGLTDDNFFFQRVTVTSGGAHLDTHTMVLNLPGGMTIADTDDAANGYLDEVSLSASMANATITGATASTITVTIGAAGFASGQTINLMFPVVTQSAPADASQDYWVDFSVVADDVADGAGYFVTFVDPGPKAINFVAFESNLTANDDSTTQKGDRYPNTATATLTALPDLIFETANIVEAANSGPSGAGITLGYDMTAGADGGNETTYTVWVSTDSTLAHVDSLTAGVFHAVSYDTMLPYIQDEAGTGNIRYALAGYPEGDYYFYVTSYLTGDFPLSRSDKLVVRHWPVINAVGYDRDHNSQYTPGAANDDQNLTLDSGGYYSFAGVKAGANAFTYVDLYANVDDLDDNAKIHLFYSSNSSLTDSSIVFTGSAADSTLAVASLTNATVIATDMEENARDAQGFVRYRWSVNPDSVGVIPTSDLTVYCVTTDGKHYQMSKMQGTNAANLPEITQGAAALTTTIRHSPKIVIDAFSEYDEVAAGDVQFDTSKHDQIMISWGKTGVNGDIDVDDDAVIDFYIIQDAGFNGTADFSHDGANALRTYVANNPTLGHKINPTTLGEKFESKERSWYTWDLKSDFATSGWYPVDFTSNQQYIIYGVISENRASNNTEIVFVSGSTFVTAGDAVTNIEFINNPFARLATPPAEGITVNAEETYRLPFTAFDWDADGQVGIFVVKNDAVGFNSGPMTATPADLIALAIGKAYCLTDADGDHANAGNAWLAENSATYYDMTIRPPHATNLAKYTRSMSTPGASTLSDGTYWVYIGVDPDNDGFVDGTEVLYRAPGPLTVVNAGIPAAQRNLTLSPMEVNVARNDTLTFTLKASDNGGNVDRMDAYISVDKNWWTLVSPTAPFTAAAGYTGKLIANTVLDDVVNNRWILRAVVFDGGNTFGIADTGTGDEVASFKLVSKGTDNAIQHLTSVGFVNDPGNGWLTKFSNDGTDISINFLSSNVKIVPRGILEGIVELQGRNNMAVEYTFELRERSGYEAVYDSLFYAANDADSAATGIQFVPDTDGKFTFWQVPSGEYDLVVKYDRYLAKKVPVNMYTGIDTLFVSFGQLKGGDVYGYSDSLSAVYPDNQIDTDDINRVATAFLSTSANPKWNNGADNWMWADVNEDGIVETDDLSLTTANAGSMGAQPVYKPGEMPSLSNIGAVVEFLDVPQQLQAGQTYTIRVATHNAAAVRAYFVNMQYDAAALQFDGIVKGGFIDADSHSFPVVSDGMVGLANSAYGDYVAVGDGILAEVTFTARVDGAFTAGMLGFDAVSFVNAEFEKENLITEPTGADNDAPVVFALGQNYPNPFNPSTVIGFTVPQAGQVTLNVYDMLGRTVRTLVSESRSAGYHTVVWDGRDGSGNMVSNGVYLYTIKSGKFSATKKMMFLK